MMAVLVVSECGGKGWAGQFAEGMYLGSRYEIWISSSKMGCFECGKWGRRRKETTFRPSPLASHIALLVLQLHPLASAAPSSIIQVCNGQRSAPGIVSR